MADNKKYYWLKLQKDFFKRHDVRIIEEMQNGKDYILFYLKLILESITHEGQLRFSEAIPYNDQMLSVITNTNIDIVRAAMKVFTELGMIEIMDDQTIYMNEVNKMIGSESSSAERVRNYRKKQKMLHCNTDVKKCNTEIEIELEKEIDKDKKENIKRKTGFVKPTVDEVRAYCQERKNNINPEAFVDFYESKDWMIGKNKMKDWKAAVRTWERGRSSAEEKKPVNLSFR